MRYSEQERTEIINVDGDNIARIEATKFIKRYRGWAFNDVFQQARLILLKTKVNWDLDKPQIYKYLYKRISCGLIDYYRRETGSRNKTRPNFIQSRYTNSDSVERSILSDYSLPDATQTRIEINDVSSYVLQKFTAIERKVIRLCIFEGATQREAHNLLSVPELFISDVVNRFKTAFILEWTKD